jgi:hypothetical protein
MLSATRDSFDIARDGVTCNSVGLPRATVHDRYRKSDAARKGSGDPSLSQAGKLP